MLGNSKLQSVGCPRNYAQLEYAHASWGALLTAKELMELEGMADIACPPFGMLITGQSKVFLSALLGNAMEEDVFATVFENGRVVIPEPVRWRLGLKPGAVLRIRVTGDRVTIEQVREAADDTFATFSEWSSAEDDELYRGL